MRELWLVALGLGVGVVLFLLFRERDTETVVVEEGGGFSIGGPVFENPFPFGETVTGPNTSTSIIRQSSGARLALASRQPRINTGGLRLFP
jgi:hypothetical protein